VRAQRKPVSSSKVPDEQFLCEPDTFVGEHHRPGLALRIGNPAPLEERVEQSQSIPFQARVIPWSVCAVSPRIASAASLSLS
jgi:hypothetical protein